MARALQFIGNNTVYFQQAAGLYRYFYRHATWNGAQLVKAGKLSIQVSKAQMEKFRRAGTSATKAALDVVSVLSQGGGWYRIVATDLAFMNRTFGVSHDALRFFLKIWNAFFNAEPAKVEPRGYRVIHVSPAQAVQRRHQELRVGRVSPEKTEALLNRFSRQPANSFR